MKFKLLFDECPKIQSVLHKYESTWRVVKNYYFDSHETRYILEGVDLIEVVFVKLVWDYRRNISWWTYRQI